MNSKPLIVIAAVLILLSVGGTAAQENNVAAGALSKCAARQVDAPARGLLASDGDRVYIGTVNGDLSSLDSKSLAFIWRAELGGAFASDLLLTESGILVVTNASGESASQENSTIRLVSKESGITAWSVRLQFSEHYYLGKLNGGVAAVTQEGTVTVFDPSSGQIRWQSASLGALSTKPAFHTGKVAFGTGDKQVIIVSARNGDPPHKQLTDFVPTSISFTKNGGFLTGDERGNVALFGAQGTKSVWKFKSGAAVSSVQEANDGILITSLDNFVYLISDYNGDVIWKRRLPGRIVEGGLVVNGHFVALIYGDNSAYVIELEKGKVVDALPPKDADLINQVPILVRDRAFALTTADSVEIFSVGGCNSK